MEKFLKSLPESHELLDFKLERVLGQGGFGITYLGLDMNLRQQVAIKEYYPREFADRDSTFTIHPVGDVEERNAFAWGLKRFLDEARVLAQLSHPNVISVRRFFEANGTAYLVMEYCDGKPLDQIIRDHGPLSESELSGILSPLLDGLEHVHNKAFLHRDIKPSNVFVRRNGSPVLLDFGAAKTEMTSYSKSVTSLATAGYAPFEQYSTKGKQGTWSDIYGLSATIYKAISGIKPPDAPDRMLEDTLVPAAELLKGKFSPSLLMTLDRALAVRPEARPQTVGEFREFIKGQAAPSPLERSVSAEGADVTVGTDVNVVSRFEPNRVEDTDLGDGRQSELPSSWHLGRIGYLKPVLGLAVVVACGSLFFTLAKEKSPPTISTFDESKDKATERVTPVAKQVPVVPPADVEVPKVKNESVSESTHPRKSTPTAEKSAVFPDSNSKKDEAPIPKISAVPVEPSERREINSAAKATSSFDEIDRAIEAGQLTIARALLEPVIRDEPENAGARFRIGQIFLIENKYSEARQQLDRARIIDPSLRFTEPGRFQALYNKVVAFEKMSKPIGRN